MRNQQKQSNYFCWSRFVVTGQVLPHALNTLNAVISIPLNLTIGDGLFTYSSRANFTIGSNATFSAVVFWSLTDLFGCSGLRWLCLRV